MVKCACSWAVTGTPARVAHAPSPHSPEIQARPLTASWWQGGSPPSPWPASAVRSHVSGLPHPRSSSYAGKHGRPWAGGAGCRMLGPSQVRRGEGTSYCAPWWPGQAKPGNAHLVEVEVVLGLPELELLALLLADPKEQVVEHVVVPGRWGDTRAEDTRQGSRRAPWTLMSSGPLKPAVLPQPPERQ